MKHTSHTSAQITRAATLFFMVRGLVRTKLAQGKRLDPYAWLRIETMVYIRDHAGVPMKDVAAYLSITAPSATSLVNALVKAGYVERRADPTDKRTSRVYLTRQGKAKLEKATRHGMQVLGGLFAPLSGKDLAAFTSLLERIQESGEKP